MRRHDQLAAALVGDPLFGAEPVEGARAFDAEGSLQGARLVIEAGVDDAAVVPALMSGEAVFRLEHGHGCAALRQRHGRRGADQTAADDGDVYGG